MSKGAISARQQKVDTGKKGYLVLKSNTNEGAWCTRELQDTLAAELSASLTEAQIVRSNCRT